MKFALLSAVALIVLSCTNHTMSPSTHVNGKWVDVNTTTDTLTFIRIGDQEAMVLGRGKEMSNGYLLPKYGSGPYDFKLMDGDMISLRWMLSSNAAFNEYYFKKSGDELVIGNFFDRNASGELLTFKRLRK